MKTLHKTLVDADLHKFGYVEEVDPGAVGSGIGWVDTSLGTGKMILKVRDAANTGWETLGTGQMGAPVTGGTANSVLFVGATGLMAQDNPGLTYVPGTGLTLDDSIIVTGAGSFGSSYIAELGGLTYGGNTYAGIFRSNSDTQGILLGGDTYALSTLDGYSWISNSGSGYFTTDVTAGSGYFGNMSIGSGSITDSGGTINFGNENLITEGNMTVDSITLNATLVTIASGSTIQATINDITDATASKPYVVFIPPGVYTEQIVMKDYVSIKGSGMYSTSITWAGAVGDDYATIFPANGVVISDLSIKATDTNSRGISNLNIATTANDTFYVLNCFIEAEHDLIFLVQTGVTSYVFNCVGISHDDAFVIYTGGSNNKMYIYNTHITHTGDTVTYGVFRNTQSTSRMYVYNSYVIGNIVDTTTYHYCVSGYVTLYNTDIEWNATTSSNLYAAYSSGNDIEIHGGKIRTTNSGAGAEADLVLYGAGLKIYGVDYETTGGTGTIQGYGVLGDDINLFSGDFTTLGLGTFGNLDVDTLNLNGNVISDSTGTISFDNENLTTTGNLIVGDSSTPGTGGQGAFYSQTFPVVDMVRDTLTTGGYVYGAVRLERIMTGGTALDGSGIAFYFKSPNDAGTSKYIGLFGGEMINVNAGAEIGAITFKPSWLGVDPYGRATDVDIMATSSTTADLRVKSGNLVVGDIQYTAVPLINPGYALVTVENATNDILKMKMFTRLASTNDVVGLGFGVHTSSTVRIMKSSIFHQRKGSWGQGDLVFAVDANADQADVATTDEVMRLSSTAQIITGIDTYWTGAGSGLPYAEIYMYNNTTADSIATATLAQLTRFDTNGESNNCTPDHTNDHITITKAGRYKINMSVSFSGTGSVTWTGGVYKNNGATQLANLQTHRKLGASGDVGSASVTGIASLSANDTVEVWFQHAEGVDKSITVKDCTLNVIQIGG